MGQAVDGGIMGPVPGARMAAVTDNAPSLRRGDSFGIVPQLRRPLTFLDLIPAVPVQGKTFDYVIESGSLDSAAEVPEGTIKPEANAVYNDATATVQTIAHWIKVNKQQLADSDDLAARLRSRLAYGVLRRLESQVINGDGLGVNVRGILQTTGTAQSRSMPPRSRLTRCSRASVGPAFRGRAQRGRHQRPGLDRDAHGQVLRLG